MSNDVIHYIVRDEKSLIYLAPLLRGAINNNCRYNRVGRYSAKLEKVLYREKKTSTLNTTHRSSFIPSLRFFSTPPTFFLPSYATYLIHQRMHNAISAVM